MFPIPSLYAPIKDLILWLARKRIKYGAITIDTMPMGPRTRVEITLSKRPRGVSIHSCYLERMQQPWAACVGPSGAKIREVRMQRLPAGIKEQWEGVVEHEPLRRRAVRGNEEATRDLYGEHADAELEELRKHLERRRQRQRQATAEDVGIMRRLARAVAYDDPKTVHIRGVVVFGDGIERRSRTMPVPEAPPIAQRFARALRRHSN